MKNFQNAEDDYNKHGLSILHPIIIVCSRVNLAVHVGGGCTVLEGPLGCGLAAGQA